MITQTILFPSLLFRNWKASSSITSFYRYFLLQVSLFPSISLDGRSMNRLIPHTSPIFQSYMLYLYVFLSILFKWFLWISNQLLWMVLQDSQDPNPLIRALAVRTMGCIRVDKITEYLCDPLQRCLKVDLILVYSLLMLAIGTLY